MSEEVVICLSSSVRTKSKVYLSVDFNCEFALYYGLSMKQCLVKGNRASRCLLLKISNCSHILISVFTFFNV